MTTVGRFSWSSSMTISATSSLSPCLPALENPGSRVPGWNGMFAEMAMVSMDLGTIAVDRSFLLPLTAAKAR